MRILNPFSWEPAYQENPFEIDAVDNDMNESGGSYKTEENQKAEIVTSSFTEMKENPITEKSAIYVRVNSDAKPENAGNSVEKKITVPEEREDGLGRENDQKQDKSLDTNGLNSFEEVRKPENDKQEKYQKNTGNAVVKNENANINKVDDGNKKAQTNEQVLNVLPAIQTFATSGSGPNEFKISRVDNRNTEGISKLQNNSKLLKELDGDSEGVNIKAENEKQNEKKGNL